MRIEATVAKWGNSLAVRLPQPITKQAKLSEGDSVSLEVSAEGDIVLRPARPKYELTSLLKGVTAKNLHTETDFGEPVGEEIW